MSWPGSSFFIRRANVRPAGPPPMQTMRMQSSSILEEILARPRVAKDT
jgi:hypothetical protein